MSENAASPVEGPTAEQRRMGELFWKQGFHCCEILIFLGLEAQGKTDPDLIRAAGQLSGGIGFSGKTCGALMGGALLLGLYAGRGSVEEEEHPRLRVMTNEFIEWFAERQEKEYGGITCSDITDDEACHVLARCPKVLADVVKEVKSILREHGFEWNQGRQQTDATKTVCSSRAAP